MVTLKSRKKMLAKKGISMAKKKNIRHNKLSKQGVFSKESRKQKRKEKRIDERNKQYVHLQSMKKREEAKEKEPDYEITGEDMMEMIDQDDMATLLEAKEKSAKNEKAKMEKKKLLPVRTEDGWHEMEVEVERLETELSLTKYKREKKLKKHREEEEETGIYDQADEISSEEEDEKVEDTPKERSVSEILAERKRKLKTKKIRMACLASNLIENPFKVANLRMLMEILLENDPLIGITVRKYCAVTLLHVFHNILPLYRIQEKNLEQKMKKETFATAKQEIELLSQYRKYLQVLESFLDELKGKPKNLGLLNVSRTAIQCLGDLLTKHSHFNYSVNIVQALVPYLNNGDKEIRTIVYTALSQTIRSDKSCYMTVEIIRKVNKLIHRLRFKVKPEAVEVFLSVRVYEMKNSDFEKSRSKRNCKEISHKERLIKKLSDQAKVKPSRKQKKEIKKMAKLREQMSEINTVEMQNVQNTKHTEILQSIFGIFIHVLKRRPNSKLMPVVLKGLAKFAHLINMEFFSDMLAVMNQFLEEGILSKRESLHCIQTVFTILSGQGESLNIDPNRFYKAFYVILAEMNAEGIRQNIEVILEIFKQMLIHRKKKVSTAKVLSFTKRLATLCLTLPHHHLIPSLVTLKSLLATFSCTEALLDPDPEGAPGMYLPAIGDPEHANSASTALWDLHYCMRHYHSTVKLMATTILSDISSRSLVSVSTLMKKSPEQLINDFDISKMKFKPSLPDPSVHLEQFMKKRKTDWNKIDLVYEPETKKIKIVEL